jgi:hypothetical protein
MSITETQHIPESHKTSLLVTRMHTNQVAIHNTGAFFSLNSENLA